MENNENETIIKEKKNIKPLLITLCVLILVLTGLITYLVLFRNNNDDKSSKSSDNNKTTEKTDIEDKTDDNNDNTTNEEFDLNADDIKVYDMKNQKNTCFEIPEDFIYEGRQIITINNFYLDGQTHTMYIDRDWTTRKDNLLMDGKVIRPGYLSESLPLKLCNFDKYILYEFGWEGTYVNIFNTKGEKVLDYKQYDFTKYNNGKLYIQEVDCGTSEEDERVLKYYIDTTSDVIEKKDLQSEKCDCDAMGCY